MILALVAAFVLGTSPAFACLLWFMKKLTDQEKVLTGGARDFIGRP